MLTKLRSHHYPRFKHKVRKILPDSIRFRTVCRKCRALPTPHEKKCVTCLIEHALSWGKAW